MYRIFDDVTKKFVEGEWTTFDDAIEPMEKLEREHSTEYRFLIISDNPDDQIRVV